MCETQTKEREKMAGRKETSKSVSLLSVDGTQNGHGSEVPWASLVGVEPKELPEQFHRSSVRTGGIVLAPHRSGVQLVRRSAPISDTADCVEQRRSALPSPPKRPTRLACSRVLVESKMRHKKIISMRRTAPLPVVLARGLDARQRRGKRWSRSVRATHS